MNPILLFDADGVIINAKMFSKHLADDFGITTEMTKEFFTTVFPDCLEGKADLREAVQPFLVQWGWQKSVDEFLSYWFSSEHVVDEKLIAEIQKIRSAGIACYVATNQERYRTEYMKNEMMFGTWFDGIFSSAQLGYKKPKTEFYSKIAELLQVVEKDSVWFFDDTEANIAGAKGYGFNAVLYTGFPDFKKLVNQQSWLQDS